MKDNKEIESIKDAFASIMPDDTNVVFFKGQFYPGFESISGSFQLNNGEVKYLIGNEDFNNVKSGIVKLFKEIQSESDNAWNHFEFTMTKNGEVDLQTVFVPKEDHWPGLGMKRVSEITLEEARKVYIPQKEWEYRKRLFSLPDHERVTEILVRTLLGNTFKGTELATIIYDAETDAIIEATDKNEDGSVTEKKLPQHTIDKFKSLFKELRASEPYSKEPWSKVTLTVDKNTKFDMDFEYKD